MEPEAREVRHRQAARVLPVNAAGEVLLLLSGDPWRPDQRSWGTAGGGLEPGESARTAAARELAEETGIVADEADLLGPIAKADVEFDWERWHLVQDQTYFALALDGFAAEDVSLDGLEPLEVGTIDRAAWWTPDALAADQSAIDPDLPQVMEVAISVVRGAVPRVTARVVPVDDAGRVLVLRRRLPQGLEDPEREVWGSIGGEVEAGESLVEAALRELAEETGLRVEVDDLTPAFHRGAHRLEKAGTTHHRHSTFFAVALHGDDAAVPTDLRGLAPDERGAVRGAGWRRPEDLRTEPTTHPDLPEITAAAVRAVRGAT